MRERTFGRFIARKLRKRLRRLLRRGPIAVTSGAGDVTHRLRISVKRLRYDLEFASAVAPGTANEALRELALLQERLGTLADLDAFDRTYADLLAALPSADDRRSGIESLRAAAKTERVRALARVRDTWSGAEGAPYPGKLAASISATLGSLSNES